MANILEHMSGRQAFCEFLSKTLLENLCRLLAKELRYSGCIVQCVGSGTKRKQTGFLIPNSIVNQLLRLFHPENNDRDRQAAAFMVVFERSLSLTQKQSTEWAIPVANWSQERAGYRIEVDKVAAFQNVIKKILHTPQRECPEERNAVQPACLAFCHLSLVPSLDDLRSLILCSLIQLNSSCSVVLSVENTGDVSPYETLVDQLDLGFNICYPNGQVGRNADSGDELPETSFPKCFADCLVSDKSQPRLSRLRKRKTFDTAFISAIHAQGKNYLCNIARCSILKDRSRGEPCRHVCDCRKRIQAQQTELCSAWYQDQEGENLSTEEERGFGLEEYFVHAGTQSSVPASAFLDLRRQQIKDSFEAKHQVKATGEFWTRTINQMMAAVVKMELLGVSMKTRLKVKEDGLPSDTTFVLYNYSRLSTLLRTFADKVDKGEYPPLPPVTEIDFSLLVEETEWELFIDHLWVFEDIDKTSLVMVQDAEGDINAHRVITFLQRLCRCLSTFYSRHHILVENFEHLIPLIHARIYLIKAILHVMTKAFNKLGIKPLLQM